MTGRAVVLLLIAGATLFAAFNVGVGWLYALGFLFLSYAVGAFVLADRALSGLRVVVHPAAWTSVDEPLTCTVAVEHPGRRDRAYLSFLARPLGAAVRLWPFRGSLVPEDWGHALVMQARAGERTLVTLGFPAPRRGVFPLPGVLVQAPAFGLGAVHRMLPVDREVIVRPRVHDLPELPWLGSTFDPDASEYLGMQSAGFELIKTVREYRPGDPMKSIHWRSTAKVGELRVKETEGGMEVLGRLAIALDLGPEHTPETLEHAITLAASLCAHAHASGLAPYLYSQAGTPKAQDLDSQLDWLACRTEAPVPLAPSGDEGSALLVSASRREVEGFTHRIYVGEERAPRGAIACPPGPGWVERLRGPHVV